MKNHIVIFAFLFPMLALAHDQIEESAPTYTTQDYHETHGTGFVRQPHFEAFMASAPRVSFTDPANKIPGKFTLRNHAGPVEDQGQCGSCWDFSLTTALRGSLMAHGKDPGRLSFNYLLNCDNKMQGCNGGDFTAADLLIAPLGAPKSGADGYYGAYQGKCEPKPAIASAKSYKLLGNDGGSFPNSPTPSFQDIAYVVAVLHQPVSVDVTVVDEFQTYKWGVFNSCYDNDPKDINHMVVVEGYDCEKAVDKSGNCILDANGNLPNGVGHWIIRNSWGTSWGDNGYINFAITNSKGQKCDSVAADALFFDVGN